MATSFTVHFVCDYATVSMTIPKETLLDQLPTGFDPDEIHLDGDNEEMFSDLAIQITSEFAKDHYGWDVLSVASDIEVEQA